MNWVSLTDLSGAGLLAAGEWFNFSASHYTTENVEKARHQMDLVEEDFIVLNIDHQQNGLALQAVDLAFKKNMN